MHRTLGNQFRRPPGQRRLVKDADDVRYGRDEHVVGRPVVPTLSFDVLSQRRRRHVLSYSLSSSQTEARIAMNSPSRLRTSFSNAPKDFRIRVICSRITAMSSRSATSLSSGSSSIIQPSATAAPTHATQEYQPSTSARQRSDETTCLRTVAATAIPSSAPHRRSSTQTPPQWPSSFSGLSKSVLRGQEER